MSPTVANDATERRRALGSRPGPESWLGAAGPASPCEPASGTIALVPRLARVRIGSGGSTGSLSVGAASVAAPPSAALRARSAGGEILFPYPIDPAIAA